jgi:hypothetical protein
LPVFQPHARTAAVLGDEDDDGRLSKFEMVSGVLHTGCIGELLPTREVRAESGQVRA